VHDTMVGHVELGEVAALLLRKPLSPHLQADRASLGPQLTHVANEVVGAVGLPSNNAQGLRHHETVLQERGRGEATEHLGPADGMPGGCPQTGTDTTMWHAGRSPSNQQACHRSNTDKKTSLELQVLVQPQCTTQVQSCVCDASGKESKGPESSLHRAGRRKWDGEVADVDVGSMAGCDLTRWGSRNGNTGKS
jgi:hypothetical protein